MLIDKLQSLPTKLSEQINALWNSEYPVKLKDRFPLLLEGVDEFCHYLILSQNRDVMAWAVKFTKDGQTRFSIIVHPEFQKLGFGKALLNRLKQDHSEFYGWVIDHNNDLKSNGEYYISPLSFYLNKGFELVPDARIDNEMIQAVLVKWKN
jgi:GNAT superfamily N-acetyltransferase